MEHYEIDDVRNRPKVQLSPLRVALFTPDQLAFLHVKNDHQADSVTNLRLRVDTNFSLERDGIDALDTRGIRELHAQAERYFLLASVPTMLHKNPEPELKINTSYEFHGTTFKDTVTFYIADLINSAIVRSHAVKALEKLGDKFDKISGNLEKIHRDVENLSRIADGTGLRISQRTLRALKDHNQLFDPYEFDWEGYKIVLEIPNDEAIRLHHVFGTIDSPEGRQKRYNELPEELRRKFERYFKVAVV